MSRIREWVDGSITNDTETAECIALELVHTSQEYKPAYDEPGSLLVLFHAYIIIYGA